MSRTTGSEGLADERLGITAVDTTLQPEAAEQLRREVDQCSARTRELLTRVQARMDACADIAREAGELLGDIQAALQDVARTTAYVRTQLQEEQSCCHDNVEWRALAGLLQEEQSCCHGNEEWRALAGQLQQQAEMLDKFQALAAALEQQHRDVTARYKAESHADQDLGLQGGLETLQLDSQAAGGSGRQTARQADSQAAGGSGRQTARQRVAYRQPASHGLPGAPGTSSVNELPAQKAVLDTDTVGRQRSGADRAMEHHGQDHSEDEDDIMAGEGGAESLWQQVWSLQRDVELCEARLSQATGGAAVLERQCSAAQDQARACVWEARQLQDSLQALCLAPSMPGQDSPTQASPTQGTPTQGTLTQGSPTQGTLTQDSLTQGSLTQRDSLQKLLQQASCLLGQAALAQQRLGASLHTLAGIANERQVFV